MGTNPCWIVGPLRGYGTGLVPEVRRVGISRNLKTLFIRELRTKAEAELGDKFNIKDFHQVGSGIKGLCGGIYLSNANTPPIYWKEFQMSNIRPHPFQVFIYLS